MDGFVERCRPRHDRRHAERVADLEEAVQGGTPEVALDEGDLLAGAQQRDGEVGDRRRLALGRLRTGDEHGLGLPVEVDELEVGAQEAVHLGCRAARVFERDHAPGAALVALELADGAEQRHVEGVGDVVDRVDLDVEALAHEGESDAQDEGGGEGEHAVAQRLGAGRRVRDLGCLADGDVAGDERLDDLELTAAVEERRVRQRVARRVLELLFDELDRLVDGAALVLLPPGRRTRTRDGVGQLGGASRGRRRWR